MNIRRIISLISFLSFFMMLLTSFILFIVPAGRVAYWADWRLWGLTKEQWGDIHINMGILFLLSLGWHIYYNWKPLTYYLKDKAKTLKIFTPEFNVALAVVVVFLLGTLFMVPPFSSVLSFGDSIKDDGAREYGEPPYGHAELSSLKTFTMRMGMDLEKAVEKLKAAGFRVEGEKQTLAEIAAENQVTPQKVYQAMAPEAPAAAVFSGQEKEMPESPPPGTGSLTLADLCGRYNLNIKTIIRKLEDEQIKAAETMTIKQIAEAHQLAPADVYMKIRAVAVRPSAGPAPRLPDSPVPGTGNLTLVEFSSQYGLNADNLVRKLGEGGIKSAGDWTIKQIAEENGTSPIDIYEAIKSFSTEKNK